MSTVTAFHFFPLLPSELRVDIWKLALCVPRVVKLTCERELVNRRHKPKSFASRSPVPALLRTCRESRSEALLTYAPAFRTPAAPNYTYVAFEQDTIECPDNILEYMGAEEAHAVQSLILDVIDTAYFGHYHLDALMRMRKLRELELRVKNEIMLWAPERRFIDNTIRDFEMARKGDLTWDCPRVRILDRETGEELEVIPGGCASPEELE